MFGISEIKMGESRENSEYKDKWPLPGAQVCTGGWAEKVLLHGRPGRVSCG